MGNSFYPKYSEQVDENRSLVKSEKKILVLGVEGSGKSTICQQIRMKYGQNITDTLIQRY
jgi:GTPase SAR1 family protein